FGLIVPSIIEDKLIGILMLGEKTDWSLYSEDDINVFRILSHQTSLAIENCIFFEEFKKTQSKIFEAEKLASIGGMADGVAHQIKNRLNHFSIASGELKFEVEDFMQKHPDLMNDAECKKTFDYILEITESLLTNVKRTDAIVRGILSYARTSEKDNFFDYFSLKEIINLSMELLQIKHQTSDVDLKEEMGSIDIIWGVKAQIMEVIYNILDNAYEATQQLIFRLDDSEKLNYRLDLRISAREEEDYYLIVISDNGIGVKEEDKLKIFAPFFTTKSSYKPLSASGKSGTGIGMYIVKRLVEENHNGTVWFESEYMKGTTFHVRLPKTKKKAEERRE
ncbi:MAG: ATP-binding protein, partial [Candidatus Omnitrophota bacterium]